MYFVRRDSPEWVRMWRVLGMLVPNRDMPDPTACYDEQSGEEWQYMGTETGPGGWARVVHYPAGETSGPASDDRWIAGPCHTFRHRSHPRYGSGRWVRVYVRLAAVAGADMMTAADLAAENAAHE